MKKGFFKNLENKFLLNFNKGVICVKNFITSLIFFVLSLIFTVSIILMQDFIIKHPFQSLVFTLLIAVIIFLLTIILVLFSNQKEGD
jgi:hypothetical protein